MPFFFFLFFTFFPTLLLCPPLCWTLSLFSFFPFTPSSHSYYFCFWYSSSSSSTRIASVLKVLRACLYFLVIMSSVSLSLCILRSTEVTPFSGCRLWYLFFSLLILIFGTPSTVHTYEYSSYYYSPLFVSCTKYFVCMIYDVAPFLFSCFFHLSIMRCLVSLWPTTC